MIEQNCHESEAVLSSFADLTGANDATPTFHTLPYVPGPRRFLADNNVLHQATDI